MAHFYAGIKGCRGQATRLGSKNSGITAFINGWEVGADVSIGCRGGEDIINITLTTGSAAHGGGRLRIGSFTRAYLDEALGEKTIALSGIEEGEGT